LGRSRISAPADGRARRLAASRAAKKRVGVMPSF
jgi:hypothetical protein